jgi:hypothetical protein
MLARLAVVAAAMVVASTAFAQSQGEWIADPKTGCKVWIGQPRPNVSVTWTGKCANGLVQGQGIVQWFEDGKPQSTSEGTYQDGKLEGRGILTWSDGTRYEGGLVSSRVSGHGVFYFASGGRFEGELRDGLPNGYGTLTHNGVSYAGNWTNGCFKQGNRTATLATTKEACGFK